MPKDIEPMLATLSRQAVRQPGLAFRAEDGWQFAHSPSRTASKLEMRTRNDRPLADRFPTLAAALKELPADSAVSRRRDRGSR